MTTEELRNKYNLIYKRLSYLYFLLLIMGTPTLGYTLTGNYTVFLILILPIISLIYFITILTKQKKEVYKLIKISIITEYLNNQFDNMKFNIDGGFSDKYISDKVYRPKHTNSKSYDYLEATYNNIDFKYSYCEVFTNSRRGSIINFSGTVLELNFPKTLSSYVSVIQPNVSHFFDGIDEIKVENTKFDLDFTVYSDDPTSVFYILTPHFMEKLRKMNTKYENCINFHFYESKIVISIDDGENFLRIYDVDGDYFNNKIKNNIADLAELIKELGHKNK